MLDQIKRILEEITGTDPDDVHMDSKLTDDLGLDSLDAVEVAMAVEEEFDIEIDDEDLLELHSIQDIVDTIQEYLD